MVEICDFTCELLNFRSDDCQLDDQLEDAILEEEKYELEPGSGEIEHDELTVEDFSDNEDYEYYYGHGENYCLRICNFSPKISNSSILIKF